MNYLVYVSLVFGIILVGVFLFARSKRAGDFAVIFKSLSSIMFVLTALLAYLANQNASIYFVVCIIFGLILGLVGDIILDLKVAYSESETLYFRVGTACFFAGHIFYLIAIFNSFNFSLLTVLLPILGALCIGFLMIITSKILGINFKKHKLICFSYASVLSLTAISAICGLIISGLTPFFIFITLGGILFLVSDVILTFQYFSVKNSDELCKLKPQSNNILMTLNHVTYYTAQFLIALSILFI